MGDGHNKKRGICAINQKIKEAKMLVAKTVVRQLYLFG
jgi:hypothetical protein